MYDVFIFVSNISVKRPFAFPGVARCMISYLISFFYRPGQEEGNIPFVENAGFGKYSGDPTVIANTVSSWLASPSLLQSMQQAALTAARPKATLDIAKDLAAVVFATRKSQKEQVPVRVRT